MASDTESASEDNDKKPDPKAEDKTPAKDVEPGRESKNGALLNDEIGDELEALPDR
jgi:hypothetical protein